MFRQDALTLHSIPERSETEEQPQKWVPKKKHEVLKAKYKCLKKLFQLYDTNVIGVLPEPIEYTDDTNTKRRRKRSHRTKTDACAGTTETIYNGDLAEYDNTSIATRDRELKIKQSCSTQIENTFENGTNHSQSSKSESTRSDNTDYSETKCSGECRYTHNLPQALPQHVLPYMVLNKRRKLTRFQSFVQRIFGIRQEAYILPHNPYAASDSLQDGRRRGLRFRRLRRTKKNKSESDIKEMHSSAILSYVQSVQRSCLMDTTPRQCPMLGCKMISYGIINYNDHLNLCHFKDRKFSCHYCHEGFEREFDKFIHENEHIGLNKLGTNLSMSTARQKSSNINTQTDLEVQDEKLKKIVSFLDKISDEDVAKITGKRRSETNLKDDTVTNTQESSEKRTVSCMNIGRCKCLSSNSRSNVTSQQYGPPVTCHVGESQIYRRQLSLHEALEKRNRYSNSCQSVSESPRVRRPLVSDDGRLNVRSIDSSSVTGTPTVYSATPVTSETKLTQGRSSESLSDPSNVYSSMSVGKHGVGSLGNIRSYKWEPGTKVIHV